MKIMTTFPKGKTKAFTISYDDGVKQDEKLLVLMKKYGIKGTFNINSGILGRKGKSVIDGINTNIATFEENEISCVYKEQEVACHTLTHKELTAISEKERVEEIKRDRANLEKIMEKPIRGFAYPFGTYNEAVEENLKQCGIHYARTVKDTKNFELPENFLTWHPTCHHNDGQVMELLQEFCTHSSEKLELFYLWGHSYEFEQRNNWDRIEGIFHYLQEYREQIYFATNEEIYQCIQKIKE